MQGNRRCELWAWQLTPFLIFTLIVLGLFGLLLVQPLWAPAAPVAEGGFAGGNLNGVRLHFGATALGQHFASAILFAYGVILATTPFSVTLLSLAGAQYVFNNFRKPIGNPPVHLILAGAFILPVLQALTGMPTFHRYMNISILLWILCTATLGAHFVKATFLSKADGAVLASLLLAIALIGEVVPFRPLYAAFRAYPLNYSDSGAPVPGHLNFSWMGWGEETMLAGKELERRCRATPDQALAGIPCKDISIETTYPGIWLPRPGTSVRFVPKQKHDPNTSLGGTGQYYVLNRSYLVSGYFKSLPAVDPEFTIDYRGFSMAWIYRGDRLRDIGFKIAP